MSVGTTIVYVGASLALSAGGYCDYKTRQIPNAVPLALILLGLFLPGELWRRAVRMVLIFALMLIAGRITKRPAGMGDVKLYAALGFLCSMAELMMTMALTIALVFAVSLVVYRKWDKTRKVPMCSYVAPAFIMMWAGDWFIMRQLLNLLAPA